MKKRNAFVKTVTLLLCLIFALFATSCSGCKKKKQDNGGDDPNGGQTASKVQYEGTHVLTAPDTAKDMVKNGASDYYVVIPAVSNEQIRDAKDEFLYLFAKATGVNLLMVTDDALPANAKYISIGKTAQFTADAAVSEEDCKKAGMYGVRIVTSGDNVYLLSGSDYGLLQSVYSFMRICFNFDMFYRNCMQIDTVTDLKLKNFDVTDVPDIAMNIADNRHYSYLTTIGTDSVAGMTDQDAKFQIKRLGFSDKRHVLMLPVWGKRTLNSPYAAGYDHNSLCYVLDQNPYDATQYNADPNDTNDYSGLWTFGNNLCYTAHGNEAAYEALLNRCCYKLQESLTRYPVAQYPLLNTVELTIADGEAMCDCDACMEAYRKDGDTPVGAVIRFCNRLRAKIGEWMDKPENAAYKREDFHIVFFAYNVTINAPVVRNEDGSFSLVNEDCAMDDGVGVYYAANTDYAFNKNMYDSVQDVGRENFAKWAWMTDYIWMWTYGTYYRDTLGMNDPFNFFSNDAYRLMAANHVQHLFNESQDYGDGATGWAACKDYVNGKLAWDVNADVQALVKKFFDAMYGAASESMYEALTAQRLYYATVIEKNDLGGTSSYYLMLGRAEYQSLNNCEYWLTLFDKALADIEPLKESDHDSWLVYWSHIEQETSSTLAIILRLFSQRVDSVTLAKYKNRLGEILSYYPETKMRASDTNMIDLLN